MNPLPIIPIISFIYIIFIQLHIYDLYNFDFENKNYHFVKLIVFFLTQKPMYGTLHEFSITKKSVSPPPPQRLKLTLNGVQGPNSLNQCGLIWAKLNSWVRPYLRPWLASWFSKLGFLLWGFFLGLKQLIFPPRWCHVGLASICDLLVLELHLKAKGFCFTHL